MNEASTYVLDASVLVAGIRPAEPFHREARLTIEWLTQRQKRICLPALVLAEVTAAIVRGMGSTQQAMKDMLLVQNLPGVQFIAVDVELGIFAAEMAASQRIRGCDAVYVALALTFDATLITLDRQQRERAPSYVEALTPGELLDTLGS